MTDDLFLATASAAPALASARTALEVASLKLFEAERIHENQGPEANELLAGAHQVYDRCQRRVIRLEREAMP